MLKGENSMTPDTNNHIITKMNGIDIVFGHFWSIYALFGHVWYKNIWNTDINLPLMDKSRCNPSFMELYQKFILQKKCAFTEKAKYLSRYTPP